MPKTGIHKEGEFALGENKIRLAENALTASPAGNFALPQQANENKFGVFVASPFHAAHDF